MDALAEQLDAIDRLGDRIDKAADHCYNRVAMAEALGQAREAERCLQRALDILQAVGRTSLGTRK